jgi:hypothetical protein
MARGGHGDQQETGKPAHAGLAEGELVQRNDAESWNEAGFVHTRFFASAGIVNASQFS